MSADFDDLVARVRAVAMDEARAALTDATYPTPAQIAEAEAAVVQRLWAELCFVPTMTDAIIYGTSNPLLQGLPYVVALPEGGEYRADIRPGGVRDYVETVGDHLRANGQGYPKPDGIQPRNPGDVPMTPRDPIHDAIAIEERPRRAHE